MPKRVLPEVVPEVISEESDNEESESSENESSEDSSESSSENESSSSEEESEDSSESSDSESSEEESEEEVKVKASNGKQTNGKTTIQTNGKDKGKQKVEEAAEKGIKHKRSDEESSQNSQPEKKKVKGEEGNGQTNGKAKENGHANGKANGKANGVMGTMNQSEVQQWRTANHLTVANVDDGSNNPAPPFQNFSEAKFPDYIEKSVKSFGFDKPTPIQAQAWPLVLQGCDIVGIAETGSGKTLAFGYPAIMHIKNKPKFVPGPKVVVLAPTRELAIQINEVLEKACGPVKYTTCCIYGGAPKAEQCVAVKKADIVVATPGRLIDLLEDGSAKLGNVDYLVFDEADRMLDMGFIPQIRRIVETLPDPSKRQTLMFSATWPVDVQKFAQTYLRSPIQITIGGTNLTGAKKVTQIIEVCQRADEKRFRLKKLLKDLSSAEGRPRILIFMLYKHTCQQMYESLLADRYDVECLHGNKTQGAREAAVKSFKEGKTNILVATDVAARGLDIKDIKYVINVELPLVMEDYIHRIGRTGRAGEAGSAYTIFCPEDKQHARQLVRILEDSSQTVPKELAKIAETAPVTKPRKTAMEQLYGDYARGADADFMMKKPTKITFN